MHEGPLEQGYGVPAGSFASGIAPGRLVEAAVRWGSKLGGLARLVPPKGDPIKNVKSCAAFTTAKRQHRRQKDQPMACVVRPLNSDSVSESA